MLTRFVKILGGDPHKRQIEKYSDSVERINRLETQLEDYSDEALRAQTASFRLRLAQGESLEDLLPEAFATVREASKRHLGQRHYDVQLIGGITLHQGIIAEMRTGEGKTLVATLPLYLNALTLNPAWVDKARQRWGQDPQGWTFEPLEEVPVGRGVHLVTVNDYLARRDARWMGSIYAALGLQVGVLQMAARTESGKKAFLVDFERESPHEDQHNLRMIARRRAYAADITYGTNSEFGFDYLRDNMAMRLSDRVQRGHHYAIIDEVDNVLIDEARTPLIISGPAHDDTEWYSRMAQVVKSLRSEDYEINERDRTVTLSEIGETHVENLLDMPLRDPERPEDVTPQQARLLGYLEQALRAQYLFKRNKEYLVQAGKVIIVDEFTGRLMPGRRWSDGLHQAVEAKEGVRVQAENVTYATITIQNYFRMYEKLAGMTGTAVTESEEFKEIYNLDVLAIPTNLEYVAAHPDTDLVVVEDRDEQGYKYEYYTDHNDPQHNPLFWKRKDYLDVVYRSEEAKLRAIVQEILLYHLLGRPILVGTTSVELSERVDDRLKAELLRRLAQSILLRHVWMQKHNRVEDGRAIPELEFLYLPLDKWDKNQESQVRKLARELEISFTVTAPENLECLLDILGLEAWYQDRLEPVLQAGIPRNVLNAKEHTAESKIIARAGELGMVNIATNMAGRGVDIKLGGEQADDLLVFVNNLLRSAGVKNPYAMTNPERLAALETVLSREFAIIPSQAEFLIASAEQRESLRNLLLEKYGSGGAGDEWAQLANILYNYDKTKFSLKTSQKLVEFWEHVEKEVQVRQLGGLHVIGSERHESRRIDNQLRGRAARQGDPGSSRFYLSMEDELMRLFGGQQAEGLMQRLKIDEAMPLEMGLVGRIVEQSQGRVEGANFDVRKHLLEYDDVLNTQRSKIYTQRDRIFVKDDLSEDVTEMLQAEVTQRVPLALEDEEGPWKLLAWLDQIQPALPLNGAVYPSYTLRLLLDHISAAYRDQSQEPGKLAFTRQVALRALLDLAERSIRAEEQHLSHSVRELLETTFERLESQVEERLELVDTFFEGLALEDERASQGPRQLLDELVSLVHVPVRLSSEQLRVLRSNGDDHALEKVVEEVSAQVEAALADQSITRLVGAVERRLEEDLELDRARLSTGNWDELATQILAAIQAVFDRRRARLIGENGGGQIAKDLEASLSKIEEPVGDGHLLSLLTQMPQGAVATFDRRTHRRVWRRTTRLTYVYAAAAFLENLDPEQTAAQVLEHLEGAQAAMRFAWGRSEWTRLASARPVDLDETTRKGLQALLGEERYATISAQPLQNLGSEERLRVVDELGRQALTEVYRQLLLGVISELWVEYLTSMEALRVSIGLEAYAQRDPLVQYKNRAFEMFQELLSNMRLGVVTRMFTFRPRDLSSVQTTVSRAEPPQLAAEPQPQAQSQAPRQKRPSKSKRRRRRR